MRAFPPDSCNRTAEEAHRLYRAVGAHLYSAPQLAPLGPMAALLRATAAGIKAQLKMAFPPDPNRPAIDEAHQVYCAAGRYLAVVSPEAGGGPGERVGHSAGAYRECCGSGGGACGPNTPAADKAHAAYRAVGAWLATNPRPATGHMAALLPEVAAAVRQRLPSALRPLALLKLSLKRGGPAAGGAKGVFVVTPMPAAAPGAAGAGKQLDLVRLDVAALRRAAGMEAACSTDVVTRTAASAPAEEPEDLETLLAAAFPADPAHEAIDEAHAAYRAVGSYLAGVPHTAQHGPLAALLWDVAAALRPQLPPALRTLTTLKARLMQGGRAPGGARGVFIMGQIVMGGGGQQAGGPEHLDVVRLSVASLRRAAAPATKLAAAGADAAAAEPGGGGAAGAPAPKAGEQQAQEQQPAAVTAAPVDAVATVSTDAPSAAAASGSVSKTASPGAASTDLDALLAAAFPLSPNTPATDEAHAAYRAVGAWLATNPRPATGHMAALLPEVAAAVRQRLPPALRPTALLKLSLKRGGPSAGGAKGVFSVTAAPGAGATKKQRLDLVRLDVAALRRAAAAAAAKEAAGASNGADGGVRQAGSVQGTEKPPGAATAPAGSSGASGSVRSAPAAVAVAAEGQPQGQQAEHPQQQAVLPAMPTQAASTTATAGPMPSSSAAVKAAAVAAAVRQRLPPALRPTALLKLSLKRGGPSAGGAKGVFVVTPRPTAAPGAAAAPEASAPSPAPTPAPASTGLTAVAASDIAALLAAAFPISSHGQTAGSAPSGAPGQRDEAHAAFRTVGGWLATSPQPELGQMAAQLPDLLAALRPALPRWLRMPVPLKLRLARNDALGGGRGVFVVSALKRTRSGRAAGAGSGVGGEAAGAGGGAGGGMVDAVRLDLEMLRRVAAATAAAEAETAAQVAGQGAVADAAPAAPDVQADDATASPAVQPPCKSAASVDATAAARADAAADAAAAVAAAVEDAGVATAARGSQSCASGCNLGNLGSSGAVPGDTEQQQKRQQQALLRKDLSELVDAAFKDPAVMWCPWEWEEVGQTDGQPPLVILPAYGAQDDMCKAAARRLAARLADGALPQAPLRRLMEDLQRCERDLMRGVKVASLRAALLGMTGCIFTPVTLPPSSDGWAGGGGGDAGGKGWVSEGVRLHVRRLAMRVLERMAWPEASEEHLHDITMTAFEESMAPVPGGSSSPQHTQVAQCIGRILASRWADRHQPLALREALAVLEQASKAAGVALPACLSPGSPAKEQLYRLRLMLRSLKESALRLRDQDTVLLHTNLLLHATDSRTAEQRRRAWDEAAALLTADDVAGARAATGSATGVSPSLAATSGTSKPGSKAGPLASDAAWLAAMEVAEAELIRARVVEAAHALYAGSSEADCIRRTAVRLLLRGRPLAEPRLRLDVLTELVRRALRGSVPGLPTPPAAEGAAAALELAERVDSGVLRRALNRSEFSIRPVGGDALKLEADAGQKVNRAGGTGVAGGSGAAGVAASDFGAPLPSRLLVVLHRRRLRLRMRIRQLVEAGGMLELESLLRAEAEAEGAGEVAGTVWELLETMPEEEMQLAPAAAAAGAPLGDAAATAAAANGCMGVAAAQQALVHPVGADGVGGEPTAVAEPASVSASDGPRAAPQPQLAATGDSAVPTARPLLPALPAVAAKATTAVADAATCAWETLARHAFGDLPLLTEGASLPEAFHVAATIAGAQPPGAWQEVCTRPGAGRAGSYDTGNSGSGAVRRAPLAALLPALREAVGVTRQSEEAEVAEQLRGVAAERGGGYDGVFELQPAAAPGGGAGAGAGAVEPGAPGGEASPGQERQERQEQLWVTLRAARLAAAALARLEAARRACEVQRLQALPAAAYVDPRDGDVPESNPAARLCYFAANFLLDYDSPDYGRGACLLPELLRVIKYASSESGLQVAPAGLNAKTLKSLLLQPGSGCSSEAAEGSSGNSGSGSGTDGAGPGIFELVSVPRPAAAAGAGGGGSRLELHLVRLNLRALGEAAEAAADAVAASCTADVVTRLEDNGMQEAWIRDLRPIFLGPHDSSSSSTHQLLQLQFAATLAAASEAVAQIFPLWPSMSPRVPFGTALRLVRRRLLSSPDTQQSECCAELQRLVDAGASVGADGSELQRVLTAPVALAGGSGEVQLFRLRQARSNAITNASASANASASTSASTSASASASTGVGARVGRPGVAGAGAGAGGAAKGQEQEEDGLLLVLDRGALVQLAAAAMRAEVLAAAATLGVSEAAGWQLWRPQRHPVYLRLRLRQRRLPLAQVFPSLSTAPQRQDAATATDEELAAGNACSASSEMVLSAPLPAAAVCVITDLHGPDMHRMLRHCAASRHVGLAVLASGGCCRSGGGSSSGNSSAAGDSSAGDSGLLRAVALYAPAAAGASAASGATPTTAAGQRAAAVGSLLGSLRGLLEDPAVAKVVHGCEQVRALEVAAAGVPAKSGSGMRLSVEGLRDTRPVLEAVARMCGTWAVPHGPGLLVTAGSKDAAEPVSRLRGVLGGAGLWRDRPELWVALDTQAAWDWQSPEQDEAAAAAPGPAAMAVDVAAAAAAARHLPEAWEALVAEAFPWAALHAPICEMQKHRWV
eukprot:XP_001691694.1 predicted protein [Chlamydomonas reinhardtii]